MIQPLKLTNREKFSQIQPGDTSAFEVEQESDFSDSWLVTSVSASAFDRQTLRRVVARQRTAYSQLAIEWRPINHGTVNRLSHITAGDVALSGFCLLLAVWILLIWQSDAPFWWVPGLSLFFGVAAVAALHDAIWSTPQSRRAQLRRQLRQSHSQLKRLSNRLALVEVPNRLQS